MLVTIMKSRTVNIKHNEKDWPKDYNCSFLEQGLVSYEDVGAGVALLRKETIDKMLPSIIGKPVLIDHKDVTPADFKKEAVGYVTDASFNVADGWFYCRFILTDDKAKKLVEKGYSVSCSFDVTDIGPGGEYHAIPYTEEINDGKFTHLALVPNPRYEECKIYVNSKGAIIKDNSLRVRIKTINGNYVGVIVKEAADGKGREEVVDQTHQYKTEAEALKEAQAMVKGMKNNEKEQECNRCHKKIDSKEAKEHDNLCHNCWDEERDKNSKNNQNLDVMSPLQLDKYLGALSDSGLQSMMDGEYSEEIKKAVKMRVEERAKLKEEELLAATPKKENRGGSTMFGFKKKENSTQAKEEALEASKFFVTVGEKKVSLEELIKLHNSKKEIEVKAEEIIEVNGETLVVDDLIKNYINSTKENEAKEETEEEKKKKEAAKKANEAKEEEEKKENEKETAAEEKREKEEGEIVRNSKKDVSHFVKLNSLREAGQEMIETVVDTMYNKLERGKNKYGTESK